MPDEAIISLRGVTKSFGSHTVLKDITFDIPKGKISAIMGPSGTGKSVLLKNIIGLLRPDAGEIWVDGEETVRMRDKDLYRVRRKFGVLFQDGALFGSMSLYDNIAFPLREHTKKSEREIRQIVHEKAEMVGLLDHLKKAPGEVSGGMKKRAGLARAIALDPKILFYDEPSAGLDPVTSAEIDQLIIDLNKRLGVTSVVVTHEMDSAFRIADRMVLLDRGRFVASGSPDEMRNSDDPLVRQFVHGLTEGPLTDRRRAGGYEVDLLGEEVK